MPVFIEPGLEHFICIYCEKHRARGFSKDLLDNSSSVSVCCS